MPPGMPTGGSGGPNKKLKKACAMSLAYVRPTHASPSEGANVGIMHLYRIMHAHTCQPHWRKRKAAQSSAPHFARKMLREEKSLSLSLGQRAPEQSRAALMQRLHKPAHMAPTEPPPPTRQGSCHAVPILERLVKHVDAQALVHAAQL